jgi:hypothetical protein
MAASTSNLPLLSNWLDRKCMVLCPLAQTYTLTVRQHDCFYVKSAAADKLVGQEVHGPVSTTAVCPYFLNNRDIQN